MNETSTTAALFLGALLLALVVSGVISHHRGEPVWPFESDEPEVEATPPPLYVGRPNFGPRQHPKLKTDHDDEAVAEAMEPLLTIPPLDTIGLGLAFVGTVWMCIEAFGQRVGWGIAALVLNVVGSAAFLFAYPARAWRPIVVQCTGYAALVWAAIAAN